MPKTAKTEQVRLEDNLFFAGTIYDSFEALEEVMGKLKLERPLFLVYLAKKAFAEEVFKAAGEKPDDEFNQLVATSGIILNQDYYQQQM
ncbi:MAG: hypothetical protein IJ824_02775 [Alphaproteobacteria bacterium]|jgi:hypothetical protein|nr:hypothetical protein [Alphaproteobacteria bacterium]